MERLDFPVPLLDREYLKCNVCSPMAMEAQYFILSFDNDESITGSLTSSGLHQTRKTLFQMHVAILLLHMIILWSTHHQLPSI